MLLVCHPVSHKSSCSTVEKLSTGNYDFCPRTSMRLQVILSYGEKEVSSLHLWLKFLDLQVTTVAEMEFLQFSVYLSKWQRCNLLLMSSLLPWEHAYKYILDRWTVCHPQHTCEMTQLDHHVSLAFLPITQIYPKTG